MKKIFYIILSFLLLGCNSENANNCYQTAGAITQQEIEVSMFDKVIVHKRIKLIITQGNEQKVVIESGKNLLNDITAEVIGGELILTDYNTCNFFRESDLTTVYITAPNLTRIRNASEKNISATGTLTYSSIYLMSVGDKDKFLSVGDFHLNIENESVKIWSNGIAVFYLNGTTNNLDLNFSDGDTRFEGKDFISQYVTVKNVSSNDVIVNPIESLKGSIHSTGDLISYNKPPVVEVDVLNDYGTLIFK